jgi:hypothetical protein
LKQLDCTVCSTDIQKYYDLSSEVITSNRKMAWQIAMHPAGHRALTPGRVTVVNNAIYPNAAAVILQPASAATAGITGTTQADRYFHCLILVNAKHMGSDQHVQGWKICNFQLCSLASVLKRLLFSFFRAPTTSSNRHRCAK